MFNTVSWSRSQCFPVAVDFTTSEYDFWEVIWGGKWIDAGAAAWKFVEGGGRTCFKSFLSTHLGTNDGGQWLEILLKAQSFKFDTSIPTLCLLICFLSYNMSLVMFSLFTKCTFGYERRWPSLPLSWDREISYSSFQTNIDEMTIFVVGYFWAAVSIRTWKFSKHVSRDDFLISFVPMWIVSVDGVPQLSLLITSIADEIVGVNVFN